MRRGGRLERRARAWVEGLRRRGGGDWREGKGGGRGDLGGRWRDRRGGRAEKESARGAEKHKQQKRCVCEEKRLLKAGGVGGSRKELEER